MWVILELGYVKLTHLKKKFALSDANALIMLNNSKLTCLTYIKKKNSIYLDKCYFIQY